MVSFNLIPFANDTLVTSKVSQESLTLFLTALVRKHENLPLAGGKNDQATKIQLTDTTVKTPRSTAAIVV